MYMLSATSQVALALALACSITNAAEPLTVQQGPAPAAQAIAVATADAPTIGHSPALHRAGVVIPAGAYRPFFRGAKGAQRREVDIDRFEIDSSYVTRAQFLAFVRQYPGWRKSKVQALFAEDSYLQDWPNDLDVGSDPQQPVTSVSWFAANAYCKADGSRLPSVAEWERVAGPSSDTAPPDTDSAARDASGHSPFRLAMGMVAPELRHTPLRVGELWEWNADFNSSVVSGRNDKATSSDSLFCGDGYRATNATDYGAFLRYSFRSSLRADYALKNLSFRCARAVS